MSVVGVDRFDNWSTLAPQDEKDRRERWLDGFQAALEFDYPGFGAAVVERTFLNARSMANFMNTPEGAVYGFAPLPFQRSSICRAYRARRRRRCPASISPRRSPSRAATAARCGPGAEAAEAAMQGRVG